MKPKLKLNLNLKLNRFSQLILAVLICAVLATAIIVSIHAAISFNVNIPSSVTIIYPTPEPTPTPPTPTPTPPTPTPTPTPSPTPFVQIGIYKNSGCTEVLTSIDWGELSPGESRNFTCYIKNQGNVPVTVRMQTENWRPTSAANYINLTWNREGASLTQATVTSATFTIQVNPAIQGVDSFAFDIIITAEGG